jgi:hypothetical protein
VHALATPTGSARAFGNHNRYAAPGMETGLTLAKNLTILPRGFLRENPEVKKNQLNQHLNQIERTPTSAN